MTTLFFVPFVTQRTGPYFPNQGSNLYSLKWKHGVLWTTREFCNDHFTLKSKSLFITFHSSWLLCTMAHLLLEMSSSSNMVFLKAQSQSSCFSTPIGMSSGSRPNSQTKPSPLHTWCSDSTSNLDFSHKGQSHNSSYLLGISTWRPCHYTKVNLKFTLQNHVLVAQDH